MTAETTTADPHAHKMGPVLATFLVAGNMIGSGVFLLPATLALTGSVTAVGWVVASVGALLLAATFAYLSRLRPDAHGVVGFVSEALGRFLGFEAGFAYWLSCVVGNLAVAVAVIGYLAFFLPVLKETPVITATATAAAIWLLTLANIVGPRFIGRLHGASLIIGLLPIIAATVLGFLYFDVEAFKASWNVTASLDPAGAKSDGQAISSSIVPIFWAFLGLESASVCARVVRDPARNVPVASFAGVGLAAVVYIAASVAVFGVLPAAALAESTAPFADVVGKLAGAAIAGAVAACAVFKAAGTLGGWVMVAAQTTQASVEGGYLPKFLSKPGKPHAPTRELLVLAVLMTAISFATLQPTIGKQFGVLINVASNLSLAMYSLCCVALLRWGGELGRGALGARVIAALGLAFSVWSIVAGDPEMLKVQGWLLVASLPIWGLLWWTGRPKPAPQA
ncbi:MAG: amino acid permease [Caulobacteraceae bacterium]|nr:amino acid permease [Caulobacteraceae bacterium]